MSDVNADIGDALDEALKALYQARREIAVATGYAASIGNHGEVELFTRWLADLDRVSNGCSDAMMGPTPAGPPEPT